MTTTKWEDRESERWIRLGGELDHTGCEEIASDFSKALLSGPPRVVIDMAAVSFVATQGIQLLLVAHHDLREQGRSLHLSGVRPHVRRIFETVGVFRAIPDWQA